MSEIELYKTIDSLFDYIKKTRVRNCKNDNCRFRSMVLKSTDGFECTFQKIEIDEDGKCSRFEKRTK